MLPPQHPGFVPLSRGFGARLGGLEVAEARRAVATLFDVLRRERALLKPDVWIPAADPGWLAGSIQPLLEDGAGLEDVEAAAILADAECGVYLETLAALSRSHMAPFAVMPDPLKLLRQLIAGGGIGDFDDEDDFADALDHVCLILVALVSAFAATGCAGIAIFADPDEGDGRWYEEFYGPLRRILEHRSVETVVVVPASAAGTGPFADFARVFRALPFETVLERAPETGGDLCVAIPDEAVPEQVQSVVARFAGDRATDAQR